MTTVADLQPGDVVRGLVIPHHYESRVIKIVGPFRNGPGYSYRLLVETRGITSWVQTSPRTSVTKC